MRPALAGRWADAAPGFCYGSQGVTQGRRHGRLAQVGHRHVRDAVARSRGAFRSGPGRVRAGGGGAVGRQAGRRPGSAYREALAATPGYAAALNGLGSVLFRKGQVNEAIARFREASQADPQLKMAFFNLGYAARKAGDAATAAQAYERYTQLEPNDADGYYGLGESYRQLGQKDKAIPAYQAYIVREKRPGEQVWVRKAREHLASMGAEPLPAATTSSASVDPVSGKVSPVAQEQASVAGARPVGAAVPAASG
ncbi:tetratricopeptide repeat protein, partial [Pyxidicoccus sp. 3LG]